MRDRVATKAPRDALFWENARAGRALLLRFSPGFAAKQPVSPLHNDTHCYICATHDKCQQLD